MSKPILLSFMLLTLLSIVSAGQEPPDRKSLGHQDTLRTLSEIAKSLRHEHEDLVTFMDGANSQPGLDADIALQLVARAQIGEDDIDLAGSIAIISEDMCTRDREHLSPLIARIFNSILQRLDFSVELIGKNLAFAKRPALVSLGEDLRRDLRKLREVIEPLVRTGGS